MRTLTGRTAIVTGSTSAFAGAGGNFSMVSVLLLISRRSARPSDRIQGEGGLFAGGNEQAGRDC
jgi:hypothetical protein